MNENENLIIQSEETETKLGENADELLIMHHGKEKSA